MKDLFKAIGFIFAIICLVLCLTWLAEGNDFFLYKYFAPKREAVRREVFENTKSYNQGMIQEIRDYQVRYIQATTNEQAALASVILHQCADYPEDKMPADVRDFVTSLRQKQTLEH